MRRFEEEARGRVVFGAGRAAEMATELIGAGARRVMTICSPRELARAQAIGEQLGERSAGCFSEIAPQVPEPVARAASERAQAERADWLLAIGGGSAIGVAKAVALRGQQRIAALPTTYAGSERTDIWGISQDGVKTTGRDERVRPALVLYDPELTVGLPIKLSCESLLNAMAHSIEALYARDADAAAQDAAERSLRPLWDGLVAIAAEPTDLAGRSEALYGSYLAGSALGGAAMALHHKLCHVLGGSFGTPHAATHAALIAHVLAFNAPGAHAAVRRMRRALGVSDPPAAIHDLARQSGVRTSLRQLGVKRGDLARIAELTLQKRYDNPRAFEPDELRALLDDSYHGRRPSLYARRLLARPADEEQPHAGIAMAAAGAELQRAEAAVLVVHGRGADADGFMHKLRSRLQPPRGGHGLVWVAPQAADNSWYPNSFAAPLDDNQPHLGDALAGLDEAWRQLTARVEPSRVVVAGFSQGACLLLSWLAQGGARPGAVVAMSGAASPVEGDYQQLAGVEVYLSLSEQDKWVPAEPFEATAAALRAGGAALTLQRRPGARHAVQADDFQALSRAVETVMQADKIDYQMGFGNAFASEARPGALPRDQNAPRQVSEGLYAEQINGTGFTVRRHLNRRSWLYRLRPQIHQHGYKPYPHPRFTGRFERGQSSPEVMRFSPMPLPAPKTDFLAGLMTFAGAGDPNMKRGMAIHLFAANADMQGAMCNLDGDLLIAPELGALRIQTELGWLALGQGEIAIIPRGIRFRVALRSEAARGYVAELFEGHFVLPERGPVGANGMADERHFLAPVAAYENRRGDYAIVVKQGGELYETIAPYSPFDVVAWHGSYTPYKYDLSKFNSMGSVSFDHPDPSILTVLTAPSDTEGRNAIDVAVFQRRWDVTEHTFRPPYFHRNSAIEFNGVLRSPATRGPWLAGAFSYTPYLTPHGVSARGYAAAVHPRPDADAPELLSAESMWIQFESTYMLRVMPWAIDHEARDRDYLNSFADYPEGEAAAQLPEASEQEA